VQRGGGGAISPNGAEGCWLGGIIYFTSLHPGGQSVDLYFEQKRSGKTWILESTGNVEVSFPE